MVQRPFSDTGGQALMWSNSSGLQQMREAIMLPGFAQINEVIHKMNRPKMSTILSSVETSRGKSALNKMKSSHDHHVNELRLARNTFSNINVTPSHSVSINDPAVHASNLQPNNHKNNIAIGAYYAMPTPSKFFPPLDEQDLQSIEQKTNSRENTIIFPEVPETTENETAIVKGIFLANRNHSKEFDEVQVPKTAHVDIEADSDKADYFLQGTPIDAGDMYSYNSSTHHPFNCISIKEAKADINAQELFASFDIEVSREQKHVQKGVKKK